MIKKNNISSAVFCFLMITMCAGVVQCLKMAGVLEHLQNSYILLRDIPAVAILVVFVTFADDIAKQMAGMVEMMFS